MHGRFAQRSAALPRRLHQIRLQFLQISDLDPHDLEFCSDQIPDMGAGPIRVALNRKQLTDFVERKSELLRLLDEFEVGHLPVVIEAVPPLRPRRARQQPRLLIEPDGIDSQAGSFRNMANMQRGVHHSQAYSLDLTPESSPECSSPVPAHA